MDIRDATRRQALTIATIGAAAAAATGTSADAQAPEGQARGGKQNPRDK